MAMKGTPYLPAMVVALLLIGGAFALHVACMSLPQYSVMDDFMALLHDVVDIIPQNDVVVDAINQLDATTLSVLDEMRINYGLWELCMTMKIFGTSTEFCMDFMDDPLFVKASDLRLLSFQRPTWLYICQITAISAAILLGLTLLLAVCILVLPRSKFGEPYGAAILAFFAGVTTLAANLIFITQKDVEFVMKSNLVLQNMQGMDKFAEEKLSILLDIYNEHFKNGTMLLANMATPALAVLCAIAFVIIGVKDRTYYEREVYGKEGMEAIDLKTNA